MLDILTVTAPIYLAIGVGYLAARYGLFDKTELRALGKFVFNIALPAILLNALLQRRFDETLNVTYLTAYAVGSLLNAAIALRWARRLAPDAPSARPYIAMGTMFSNSGFVGFPIMLLALPSVAGVSLALNMLVENILLLPLLLSLADQQAADAKNRWTAVGQSILALRKNPLILTIVAAIALSLLEIRLPSTLSRTVTLFAQASSAIALFAIGGTLHGLPFKELGAKVAAITVGKLVLHPLCIWLVLALCVRAGLPALPADLYAALILTGTLPIMSIYPILAMRHGHEKFCAAALLSTTALSFFSLSALLAVL